MVGKFTPMLACAPGPEGVSFPILATPKIDGIRAVILKGSLVSRTLKPIPNVHLRAALESLLPEGCDGEAAFGDSFQTSTSAVMTRDAPTGGFTYYAFDWVGPTGYADRIASLASHLDRPAQAKLAKSLEKVVRLVVLTPTLIKDRPALDAFEDKMLSKGFEGLIVRSPDGRYKLGRSTPKEGLMLKVKRFEDAEAKVTGWEELVRVTDDKDAHTNLLGALVAIRSDKVTFKIGSGFSAQQRKDYWTSRTTLLGKWVKYKHFNIGSDEKAAPRFPTFLGFRDVQDM